MKIFWKITRESIKILILASVISSLGGVGLETVNERLIALLPLLILVPAMNNMIGSFGTVISSRLSTLLYMGNIKEKDVWKSHKAGNLFITISIIAFISSIYISLIAGAIALFKGFELDGIFLAKLMLITLMMATLLIVLMFWLSVTAGFYIFKKNKDPDNFLIPLTTSIADLGCMLMITASVVWFF